MQGGLVKHTHIQTTGHIPKHLLKFGQEHQKGCKMVVSVAERVWAEGQGPDRSSNTGAVWP